jgi:hypothetical protein
MIAVFYGKDDFSAHEALAALRAELDTDGMLADNAVRVDGPSAKPDELLVLCQTVPFLGAHRLIVVPACSPATSAPRAGDAGARRAMAASVSGRASWLPCRRSPKRPPSSSSTAS